MFTSRRAAFVRGCLTALCCILFIRPSFSQQPDSLLQSKLFRYGSNQSMPYRLFVPHGYDAGKKYPLVLWLHGANGRGADNKKNVSSANEIGSHVWMRQEKYPCIVVAPQCPDTTLWVSNDGIDNPPDELDAVVGLLGEMRKSYAIDTTRMYVAGQSRGGVAVWELIARYPKMFAAALPLCAIGNTENAPALIHTPVWAFHGAKDDVVPVAHARAMIESITRAGGHPKYSEYKTAGHDVWNRAFREPALLDWVFSQHRPK